MGINQENGMQIHIKLKLLLFFKFDIKSIEINSRAVRYTRLPSCCL